jgi:phospholipid/cholesterol/gamma-HCH transport system substrate-binding protein
MLTVAAILAAVVAVGAIVLGSDRRQFELRAVMENAGQLVKGNRVTVGGVPVGSLTAIRLTPDNQAALTLRIDDRRLVPLHEGTTVAIRVGSLSSVAGREVALHPGPNSAPALRDGATIPLERTSSVVDLDQVLNTLDAATRSRLQALVHGSAAQYAGESAAANAGLRALNPALAQTSLMLEQLTRDEGAFERFLVRSAAVVSAIRPRSPKLEHGLASAASLTDRLAREDAALSDTLRRAPAVLRQSTATLARARGALEDLRPTLRAAQPVAPRLAALLRALAPITPLARPAVAGLSALLPDTAAVLRALPALARAGVPAVGDAATSLEGAAPIVRGARPYTPDVVAGIFNGFGGTTGGYYDANGHYARISLQANLDTLTGPGTLIPKPPADGVLTGYAHGKVARCPGAAAQPPPDRSAPFLDPAAPCDPKDTP